MRGTILIVLSLVASGRAAAEWVQVGENAISTAYADSTTVRKADKPATMSDLLDFKTAQSRPYGTPYLSQKTQREYDCNEGRVRILDLRHYSENMGKGEETYSEAEPGKWEAVAPGTASAALLEVACGKK